MTLEIKNKKCEYCGKPADIKTSFNGWTFCRECGIAEMEAQGLPTTGLKD